MNRHLHHITVRYKWIKRRLCRNVKLIQRAKGKLNLSAKTIGEHSVRFIHSYTIPLLLAFSIVYFRDSINNKTTLEKQHIIEKHSLQTIIIKQSMQIKQLQDSLHALDSISAKEVKQEVKQ